MNTRISYMYRDACNFKQFEEVVIRGRVSLEEVKPYLDECRIFIPGQIGLPELQKRFGEQGFKFPTEDDHEFHELLDCIPTEEEAEVDVSAEEFKRYLRTES